MRSPTKSSKEDTSRPRRAAKFWSPLNNWWRKYLADKGRRPVTADVELWWAEHSATAWSNNARPSWKEARVHAKCLRSTEQVKNYFREYRARSKFGGGSSGRDFQHAPADAEDAAEPADEDEAPGPSTVRQRIGAGCTAIQLPGGGGGSSRPIVTQHHHLDHHPRHQQHHQLGLGLASPRAAIRSTASPRAPTAAVAPPGMVSAADEQDSLGVLIAAHNARIARMGSASPSPTGHGSGSPAAAAPPSAAALPPALSHLPCLMRTAALDFTPAGSATGSGGGAGSLDFPHSTYPLGPDLTAHSPALGPEPLFSPSINPATVTTGGGIVPPTWQQQPRASGGDRFSRFHSQHYVAKDAPLAPTPWDRSISFGSGPSPPLLRTTHSLQRQSSVVTGPFSPIIGVDHAAAPRKLSAEGTADDIAMPDQLPPLAPVVTGGRVHSFSSTSGRYGLAEEMRQPPPLLGKQGSLGSQGWQGVLGKQGSLGQQGLGGGARVTSPWHLLPPEEATGTAGAATQQQQQQPAAALLPLAVRRSIRSPFCDIGPFSPPHASSSPTQGSGGGGGTRESLGGSAAAAAASPLPPRISPQTPHNPQGTALPSTTTTTSVSFSQHTPTAAAHRSALAVQQVLYGASAAAAASADFRRTSTAASALDTTCGPTTAAAAAAAANAAFLLGLNDKPPPLPPPPALPPLQKRASVAAATAAAAVAELCNAGSGGPDELAELWGALGGDSDESQLGVDGGACDDAPVFAASASASVTASALGRRESLTTRPSLSMKEASAKRQPDLDPAGLRSASFPMCGGGQGSGGLRGGGPGARPLAAAPPAPSATVTSGGGSGLGARRTSQEYQSAGVATSAAAAAGLITDHWQPGAGEPAGYGAGLAQQHGGDVVSGAGQLYASLGAPSPFLFRRGSRSESSPEASACTDPWDAFRTPQRTSAAAAAAGLPPLPPLPGYGSAPQPPQQQQQQQQPSPAQAQMNEAYQYLQNPQHFRREQPQQQRHHHLPQPFAVPSSACKVESGPDNNDAPLLPALMNLRVRSGRYEGDVLAGSQQQQQQGEWHQASPWQAQGLSQGTQEVDDDDGCMHE